MRLLMLTHRLPFAPNRGDRIRAFHLLKTLSTRHEVHLVSLVHDDEEEQNLQSLNDVVASARGARVSRIRSIIGAVAALASAHPLTHALLDSPELRAIICERVATVRPQAVLAYCTGLARYVLEPPLSSLPCVLDMVDVDSEKWATLATERGIVLNRVLRREARVLRAFEREVVEHCVGTTVVSGRERELADSVLGLPGRVTVAGNGIDVSVFAPPEEPRETAEVIFCGVFNYEPNEQAAEWVASEVWPRVKLAEPRAVLRLVGMNPSSRVRALNAARSIEVSGTVPDVRPYLWAGAIAVAPLKIARGVQNKVLEAVAAGLPCVVTPQVFEGLPAVVQPACVVAHDPATFAEAVIGLLRRSPTERRRLARQADMSSLTWSAQLQPLLDLLERD